MASIRSKTLSTGKKAFQVRWRDPAGREKTRQFAKKLDARNFVKSIEHQLLAGDYIAPDAGRITVSRALHAIHLSPRPKLA